MGADFECLTRRVHKAQANYRSRHPSRQNGSSWLDRDTFPTSATQLRHLRRRIMDLLQGLAIFFVLMKTTSTRAAEVREDYLTQTGFPTGSSCQPPARLEWATQFPDLALPHLSFLITSMLVGVTFQDRYYAVLCAAVCEESRHCCSRC